MAGSLNWGILATGSIANQFARGLKVSKTGKLVAVGSRTLESAAKFTNEHGGTPYASYGAVLEDPLVQAVYIATPHHLHCENTIAAAESGKAILCEKPFTLNGIEAERALAAVRANGVFFMEAFMYRCHPQTRKIVDLVHSGAIGKVLNINAEFGFHAPEDWGNFRADGAVGGGGLLDVGTYCVSFARLVAGEEPTECHYSATITKRGYDSNGSGCLKFPSGITAHFGCGIHVTLRNDFRVYGSEGWLSVDQPWTCGGDAIHLHRNGQDEETFELGTSKEELYGIEADAVAEFLEAKQCPYMTPEDTLNQMRTLDALRVSAGLHFAKEPTA